ncbi:cytochrome P450 [Micromonospora sp. MP36]|nr:cytochrome P450 [Micromonospora sp. MP36]
MPPRGDIRDALRRRPLLQIHPITIARSRTPETTQSRAVVNPFFPLVAARVRRSFEWQGHWFPQGRRVLLDLYATNHHPQLWPEPEQFRPERFIGWRGDSFSLIPQGGGDHFTGHRCPGEWLTIELMKQAVSNLTCAMSYRVPPQDLALDLARMPTQLPSGFVIDGVRRAE